MRRVTDHLIGFGLWAQLAAASINVDARHAARVTPVAKLEARAGVQFRALIPTESGKIGINPPGAEPTPANIEGHTKYLKLEGGTTTWIGSDKDHISVKVTNTNGAPATITKGVEASKNKAGGIDILLSPAVKAKLESIAKQVTPCGKKRRRQADVHQPRRRAGQACGLADFVRRVGADQELQGSFSEPLTDQMWELDSGYGSDPENEPGWEGDGGNHPGGQDTGHFADDDEGFFEGSTEGEAANTVETVVISSEEEAAALAASFLGGDAAANAAVWGGSTLTTGSFLAWLWGHLKDSKPIPLANSIPKESIHRVTKTKTKTTSTSSSTTKSSCPKRTGAPPACGENCKPTSVEVKSPKVTGAVGWACSEGDIKGCICDPAVTNKISGFDDALNQAVLDALKTIKDSPKAPKIDCPGTFSNVPSQWFVEKTSKKFCDEMMKDLKKSVSSAATAYDIYGNLIPIMKGKLALAAGTTKRFALLDKRAPPESIENYKDARFFMEWTASKDKCYMDEKDLCSAAFTKLVKANCGSNHGSAGDRMTIDASIDVGCGKLSWHVDPQPKPQPDPPKLVLGELKCHDKHRQDDVHKDVQEAWAGYGCKWYAEGKTMKKGDKEIYWHPIGFADLNTNFKISWIQGCDKFKEQKLDIPVEGSKDITCATILRDNYQKCNNGGAGGQVDVGCVRYDFYTN